MRSSLLQRFQTTRRATEALAAPLSPEDQLLQASADSSPTKWHRGHTTWFFATFVLAPHAPSATGAAGRALRPAWNALFNSYYESLGARHPRPQRGLLSRPSSAEIAAWRVDVDEAVCALIEGCDDPTFATIAPLLALGIAHEEQHQELLLTDILAAFALHPHKPAYRPSSSPSPRSKQAAVDAGFVGFEGGLVDIGADVDVGVDVGASGGFAFDNEGPRHRAFLRPFALADRLVTVRELWAFIEEGGYKNPLLWLSEGWSFVQSRGIDAPGYCRFDGNVLVGFGLEGERVLGDDEPVSHVSFYEADAIARFLGARLPTEQEWEHAATASRSSDDAAAFRDDPAAPLTPQPLSTTNATTTTTLRQLFGTCWEWTQSAYAPYPGYRAVPGALGEYNGKFMVSQLVLRGGSVLSNRAHLRPGYRNFWPAPTRFQMSGIRLARDL